MMPDQVQYYFQLAQQHQAALQQQQTATPATQAAQQVQVQGTSTQLPRSHRSHSRSRCKVLVHRDRQTDTQAAQQVQVKGTSTQRQTDTQAAQDRNLLMANSI